MPRHPKITLPAAALTALLADAVRFAGSSTDLPYIHGVQLHTARHNDGAVLVATATDRFKLAQIHHPVELLGSLPDTFLPLPEVKRLLAILKLYKDPGLSAVVQRGASALTVATDGLSVALTPVDRNLPKPLASLHALAVEAAPAGVTAWYKPEHLAPFLAVAKSLDTPLRINPHPHKPTEVLIGERFRGLLMPVRQGEGAVDAPVFLPLSELAASKAASA